METVSQIAKRFGVSRTAVYGWIRSGLPYEKEKVIRRRERKVMNPDDVTKFLNLSELADEAQLGSE